MTARTTAPLIVLAAGGTGGHMFPAEALAGELETRGYRIALISDKRGQAYKGRLGTVANYRISAAGVAGRGVVARAISLVKLGIGTVQAMMILGRLKPAAVIGFGGYAAFPTVLAATFKGIKSIIHEQNAVLGRANRLLASRVDRIAISFPGTREIPDGANGKIVTTGMPVRSDFLTRRDHDYPKLGPNSLLHILVLGGSQGARVFSHVVPEGLAKLAPELRARIRITQQCRPEDLPDARAAYKAIGIPAVLDRFFDDIPQLMAGAHLVVSRAGASSVAEITAIGRPAILVPYTHAIDDHQTYNAHFLDDAGGGWLTPEASFTPENFATRLTELFERSKTLINAVEGATRAGTPDAAQRLGQLAAELAGNKQENTVP